MKLIFVIKEIYPKNLRQSPKLLKNICMIYVISEKASTVPDQNAEKLEYLYT